MLQYFLNLPIRSKLLLPTLMMVLGFLIAGGMYWQSLQNISQSNKRQKSLNSLTISMLHLKWNVSQMLKHEKDFLWRRDTNFLELHDQSLESVLADIQAIQEKSNTLNLSLDTTSLKTLTEVYQKQFASLLTIVLNIGLDENSGLRGDMRTSIHQVEAVITQDHELALQNSMLQMQRHEKDFLLRMHPRYKNKMAQEHQRFDVLLKSSGLSDKYKKNIDDKMNAYQAGFLKLFQATLKEQHLIQDLRLEISKVEPLLAKFNQQLKVSLHTEYTAAQQFKTKQEQQFYIVLLLLLLFIAVMLWLVSKSFTKPLNQLLELVHGLAQNGNLDQRLTVKGDHELAMMAMYINQLMDHLSNMLVQVQESGQKIMTSSHQLAASSREQEATVTEQAVTTQQMAASSREIAATAGTVQDNMESVTTLARNTNQSASEGQESLMDLERALRHMIEASQAIGEKFGMLNEKAANISQVVTTITKVADQTNLLSLNAAIEAEKAGEYGRGFSVVASEIRRLANQSAVTTLEIEGIVKDMQSAVAEGVMGMDKFSDEIRSGVQTGEKVSTQLQHIITQVLELTPCIEDANEGLRNQVLGAQEISTAIEQLQTTTQQTQRMVIQTNEVIEDLNHASSSLSDGMAQFSGKVS